MRSKCPYKKTKRRVGRGIGSGNGKTAGRGYKGAGSRTGAKARLHLEGGQNTFIRRLPKRGFNKADGVEYVVINVHTLEKMNKAEVTPQDLALAGLVKNFKSGLKLLGTGEITKAVKVHAHACSKQAREKIEKAGGSVVLLTK